MNDATQYQLQVGREALDLALADNDLYLATRLADSVEDHKLGNVLAAVYRVMRAAERTGGSTMQKAVTAHKVQKRLHPPMTFTRTALTEREKDVLFHLCLDKDNHMIAKELKISMLTVKNHVQKILSLYACRTRVGAAVKAILIGDISFADIKEAYGCNNATPR